ncbi:MAG: hypothetical protein F2534_09175 [Actinobacteria bacterium]|nr:hypothetical protein [Actinomycetota bacterium]
MNRSGESTRRSGHGRSPGSLVAGARGGDVARSGRRTPSPRAAHPTHHRSHTVPLLWRFHAVHHSTTHLDWISGFRAHPFDGAFAAPALAMLFGGATRRQTDQRVIRRRRAVRGADPRCRGGSSGRPAAGAPA